MQQWQRWNCVQTFACINLRVSAVFLCIPPSEKGTGKRQPLTDCLLSIALQLKSADEAQAHAESTGHVNFSESAEAVKSHTPAI